MHIRTMALSVPQQPTAVVEADHDCPPETFAALNLLPGCLQVARPAAQ